MRLLLINAIVACSLMADTIVVNDPNDTIYVEVSEHSMNRIVFQNTIISKEYSKEKGLLVKTFENEAFLKFTPQIEETTLMGDNGKPIGPEGGQPSGGGEKKVIYDKAEPAEVFFVTEGKTYSIIFKPTDIGPRTVMVNETLGKKKEIIAYETKDAYKETMKKIAFDVHNGSVPYGYEESAGKIRYRANNLEVIKEKSYSGTLYRVSKFTVVNKGVKALSLDERDFINLAEKDPLFLSFFTKKQMKELAPMDDVSLVIVERGGE